MDTTKRLLLLLPLLVVAACSKSDANSSGSQAMSVADGANKGDVRPVDLMITERVRYALQEESATSKELAGVGISTVDGVVTLTGAVSSAAVRDRFGVITKAVGSVTRVDNKLTIK